MDNELKKLNEVKIEYLPVDEIRANEYNPNKQTEDEFNLLVKSIQEEGFDQPIIVLEKDGTIVDGEHRWRAAISLGMKAVPVIRVAMTEVQRRIATIRHNRARGKEDFGLTKEVFKEIESMGAKDWFKDSLLLDDEQVKSFLDTQVVVDGELEIPEDFNDEVIEPVRDEVKIERPAFVPQKEKKDRNITCTLCYTPEEWEIIKKAIGDANLAEGLLAMCRKAVADNNVT